MPKRASEDFSMPSAVNSGVTEEPTIRGSSAAAVSTISSLMSSE